MRYFEMKGILDSYPGLWVLHSYYGVVVDLQ